MKTETQERTFTVTPKDGEPITRHYIIPRRSGWAAVCSTAERVRLAGVVRRARRGELAAVPGVDINAAVLGALRGRMLAHLRRLAAEAGVVHV